MKKEAANEIRTYTIYKIETDVKEITGYADGIWIPCYIGSTCQVLSERMHGHISGRSAITPYIKKYGRQHFRIVAMLTINTNWNGAHKIEEIQTRIAQKVYKLLNKSIGDKHCNETKEKISKKRIGQKLSEETKRKISQAEKGHRSWNKGFKHTEETKRKISESEKRTFTEERLKKMSEQSAGKNNPRCRKIYCSTTGKYYNYIREAAKELDISDSAIYTHLNRHSKGLVFGKYKFEYVKEDE